MRPMITGTTAPPMIPVPKMPEKEPWNSATELSASDTTMGHITEAKRPIAGKAITETFAGPNKAADRKSRAPREAQMSTLRLSSILSNNIPTKQPAVNKPQNQETAAAPVVWGSKPRYWLRKVDIQSPDPSSQPRKTQNAVKLTATQP